MLIQRKHAASRCRRPCRLPPRLNDFSPLDPMDALNDFGLENWHDFEVGSRCEIISLLRAIGEKNQLIRMLVHGESDVCVTSVLHVDADGNTLELDCAIHQYQ